MVWAARNKEEINSRFPGCASSTRSDCSICARHSSVSWRNDCNNISRLISMISLQNLYFRIARIGAKYDALPAVHANDSGHHGDMGLRQNLQRCFDVPATEMLLSVRTWFAHGLEQTAASKYFCAKFPAVGAGFEKLLQQHGDGYVAVAGRRYSYSVPARQEVVCCTTNCVDGIPDANANA